MKYALSVQLRATNKKDAKSEFDTISSLLMANSNVSSNRIKLIRIRKQSFSYKLLFGRSIPKRITK